MVLQIWYFEARGRAEQIRIALRLAGVPFENKSVGPFLSWDKSLIPGGLDWGQVPAIHDTETGKTYVQSLAQLTWIGHKFDLLPSEVEEEYEILNVLNQVNDTRSDLYKFVFKGSWMGGSGLTSAKAKLETLDKKLGDRDIWGKDVSIADASCFDLLHNFVEGPSPGLIKEYPNLHRFYSSMLNDDRIKTHLESDLCYDGFPAIGATGIIGPFVWKKVFG